MQPHEPFLSSTFFQTTECHSAILVPGVFKLISLYLPSLQSALSMHQILSPYKFLSPLSTLFTVISPQAVA